MDNDSHRVSAVVDARTMDHIHQLAHSPDQGYFLPDTVASSSIDPAQAMVIEVKLHRTQPRFWTGCAIAGLFLVGMMSLFLA